MKTPSLFLLLTLSIFSGHSQAQTVELAYFKQNNGVSEQQILRAAKAMESTIEKWQGFESRELVYLGEKKWVDIVHWNNMESAQAAAHKAMNSSVCLTFFALIESTQSDMQHGEVKLIQKLQHGLVF